jgi:hypothetical protein
MSKIQDRLNELQPHIIGIRYVEGLQIVDAKFNEGWTIPKSEIIKMHGNDNDPNYYMFYSDSEDVAIDDILDYIGNVIKINIEREKKHKLLKEKVLELQKVFQENGLLELQKLKFVLPDKDIVPTLGEMDINLDDNPTPAPQLKPEQPKEKKVETKQETESTVKNVNGQSIELPNKNESGKIELQEFKEPEIKCKCGADDICPVCEEEKIGA